MEYGLFTSGYQRVGLERAFSDAAAFGYDFIELWGGRPHAYAPDLLSGGLAELRRLMERYAMPVRVYTPEHNAYPYNYMLGSDTQWADCVSYLSDAIRAGASLGADRYLELMAHDKKVSDGTLRLVLLKAIGKAVISAEASTAEIRATIEACC